MSDDFVFPQDHVNTDMAGNVFSQSRKGGLTKRELFAAMIYVETIKVPPENQSPMRIPMTIPFEPSHESAIAVAARSAVILADALLAELEKPRA